MILNNGNIKNKSKILKRYCFDSFCESTVAENSESEYINFLKTIPGIEEYNKIKDDLHDSYVSFNEECDNVVLDLELYDESSKKYERKLIFQNACIVAYNKVLRSGRIAKINRRVIAKEYLYDEFYKDAEYFYVSIIVTTKNRIRTGIYFPFVTIKFKSLYLK